MKIVTFSSMNTSLVGSPANAAMAIFILAFIIELNNKEQSKWHARKYYQTVILEEYRRKSTFRRT